MKNKLFNHLLFLVNFRVIINIISLGLMWNNEDLFIFNNYNLFILLKIFIKQKNIKMNINNSILLFFDKINNYNY